MQNLSTCSETPGKKEITKRILKVKSGKLVGILELSRRKVLPLALMIRSNDSRTCWLNVHELVRSRPIYLSILIPILGSKLLQVDMSNIAGTHVIHSIGTNGYQQPFPNIILDRIYTIQNPDTCSFEGDQTPKPQRKGYY